MVSHDVKEIVQRAKHILHLAHKQLFFGEAEKYRESELGKSFVKDLEG
jgi:ABC superfamily ATP binding cassette transporter, ABC protein